MFRKSFKGKIILPVIIVLTVVIIILTGSLIIRFYTFNDYLLARELNIRINSLNDHIDRSRARTHVAAISMASNIDVENAIQSGDRETILETFGTTLEFYQVDFFTVCDNNGIVLARTHDPENYGDSIINQQNIISAMGGVPVTDFEEGAVVKVSVRSAAPVYDAGGNLIAVILAGIRYDTIEAVDELARLLGSQITVYLGEQRIATTLTVEADRAVGTFMNPDIAEIVIRNKQEYTGKQSIIGDDFKTYYKPLINGKNEAFAAIFVGLPVDEIQTQIFNKINNSIFIGVIGLIISVVLMIVIITRITKPLIILSKDIEQVATGDLQVSIDVKTKDEVGRLSESLKLVVNVLKKLFESINTMIREHEIGNTDYVLDVSAFHGDYYKLSKTILDLANISMKDQLTSLPNRRSFNNRLDMEWHSAIRNKTYLSILLIDVDNFKTYNDTFGHQQGDIALQTVASILGQFAKRKTDFVARWGGEEFVVLLPQANPDASKAIAERIRAEVESVVISGSSAKASKVTISIGLNTILPDNKILLSDFIECADNALYKAKETGRNRVCSHEDGK